MSVTESQREFFDFLGKYTDYLESMVEGEKEKLAAILSNDLERIDHSVAAQQAVSMQMGTYEKRRAQLQSAAGYDTREFRQILKELPEEEQTALGQVFNRMEQAIQEIQYYNGKALEVVKLNLQRFGEGMQNPVKTPGYGPGKEGSGTYTSTLYEKKI